MLFYLPGRLTHCTWFGLVDSLTVELLLGKSFMDCCIRGIFVYERKIVPWLWKPVSILSTLKEINTIFTDTGINDLNTISITDNSMDNHHLCDVTRQTTIPAYMQAAVLVSCYGAWIITTEFH